MLGVVVVVVVAATLRIPGEDRMSGVLKWDRCCLSARGTSCTPADGPCRVTPGEALYRGRVLLGSADGACPSLAARSQ